MWSISVLPSLHLSLRTLQWKMILSRFSLIYLFDWESLLSVYPDVSCLLLNSFIKQGFILLSLNLESFLVDSSWYSSRIELSSLRFAYLLMIKKGEPFPILLNTLKFRWYFFVFGLSFVIDTDLLSNVLISSGEYSLSCFLRSSPTFPRLWRGLSLLEWDTDLI